jgi:hypothetical protein
VLPWWTWWPWDDDGGGLPRSSADIPGLEGSPGGLRAAAGMLRAVADGLGVAQEGCARLAEVGQGASWGGEGYAAFQETLAQAPTPGDVGNAQDALAHAAEACETLADGIADCQDRIAWCHQRIDSLCLPPEIPDDQIPVVQAIADDARAARADHQRHLDTAQDTLAALRDATVYAQPPPSFWDRVGDAWSWGWHNTRDAWNGFFDEGAIFDRIDDLHNPADAFLLLLEEQTNVWVGIWDGIREMWDGAVTASVLATPHWSAEKAQLLYNLSLTWDTAQQNPRQFAWDTGLAVIDYDTLRHSPGQWTGKLLPNLALNAIPYAGPAVAATTRATTTLARITRLANLLDRTRPTGTPPRFTIHQPLSADEPTPLPAMAPPPRDAARIATLIRRLTGADPTPGLVIPVREWNDIEGMLRELGPGSRGHVYLSLPRTDDPFEAARQRLILEELESGGSDLYLPRHTSTDPANDLQVVIEVRNVDGEIRWGHGAFDQFDEHQLPPTLLNVRDAWFRPLSSGYTVSGE